MINDLETFLNRRFVRKDQIKLFSNSKSANFEVKLRFFIQDIFINKENPLLLLDYDVLIQDVFVFRDLSKIGQANFTRNKSISIEKLLPVLISIFRNQAGFSFYDFTQILLNKIRRDIYVSVSHFLRKELEKERKAFSTKKTKTPEDLQKLNLVIFNIHEILMNKRRILKLKGKK